VLDMIVLLIHSAFFITLQVRTHDFVDKVHREMMIISTQDEVMNSGLGLSTESRANIPKQIIIAFPHSKNTINNTQVAPQHYSKSLPQDQA
jgi:hypothetical protein